jgi:hypothetical protein
MTNNHRRGYSRHDLDAVRLYETVTVLLCCQDRMPVLDLSAEPATAASCARAHLCLCAADVRRSARRLAAGTGRGRGPRARASSHSPVGPQRGT